MINHPGVGEWEQQVWAPTARVGPHVGAYHTKSITCLWGRYHIHNTKSCYRYVTIFLLPVRLESLLGGVGVTMAPERPGLLCSYCSHGIA